MSIQLHGTAKMKRKIQTRIAAGILLACAFYVAFYFHCRSSGLITHFASSHGQHDVRATDDPWSELARDMASSNTVLHAVVVAQTPSARILNSLFWPLRRVDACLIAGCAKSNEQDRFAVKSRLRLKATPVSLPEFDAIRLRVIAGRYPTTLMLQRASIRRGSITFRGADGYIRLTTNDTTVIKSSSMDHEVQVKMLPGTQHIQFHLSQEPFRMAINWSTLRSLADYCESNNCSYVDFCPELMSVTNTTSIDVDIPIDRSDDFEGEVTDWVIQSIGK